MLSNQLGSMRLMHLNFTRRYAAEIISGELKLTFYNGNPFLIDPSDGIVFDFEYHADNYEEPDEEDLIAIVNNLITKCEMFKWWVEPQHIITHELFENEVNDFMYAYWEENKPD